MSSAAISRRAGEHGERPQRDVGEIADRRRHEIKPGRERPLQELGELLARTRHCSRIGLYGAVVLHGVRSRCPCCSALETLCGSTFDRTRSSGSKFKNQPFQHQPPRWCRGKPGAVPGEQSFGDERVKARLVEGFAAERCES